MIWRGGDPRCKRVAERLLQSLATPSTISPVEGDIDQFLCACDGHDKRDWQAELQPRRHFLTPGDAKQARQKGGKRST